VFEDGFTRVSACATINQFEARRYGILWFANTWKAKFIKLNDVARGSRYYKERDSITRFKWL